MPDTESCLSYTQSSAEPTLDRRAAVALVTVVAIEGCADDPRALASASTTNMLRHVFGDP